MHNYTKFSPPSIAKSSSIHASNSPLSQLDEMLRSEIHRFTTPPTKPRKRQYFRTTSLHTTTKNGLHCDDSRGYLQSYNWGETWNSSRNASPDIDELAVYIFSGHQKRELAHKTPKTYEWRKRPLGDEEYYPTAPKRQKPRKQVYISQSLGGFDEESSGHYISVREGYNFSQRHRETEYIEAEHLGDSTDSFGTHSISANATSSNLFHSGYHIVHPWMAPVEAACPDFFQLCAVSASKVHQNHLANNLASAQDTKSDKDHEPTRNAINNWILSQISPGNRDAETDSTRHDAKDPNPTMTASSSVVYECGTGHKVQTENARSDDVGEISVDWSSPDFASEESVPAENGEGDGAQKDDNWDHSGALVGFRKPTGSDQGEDVPEEEEEKGPRKLESFIYFKQLPKELRIMIWRLAAGSEGRKVKLGIQFEKNQKHQRRSLSHQSHFKRRVPMTTLLAVNQESREEVLRYMVVLFQDSVWPNKRGRPAQIPWQQDAHSRAVAKSLCSNPQPISFDPSRDWLWLPSQFLLKSGSRPACKLLHAMNQSCPQTLEKTKMLTIDCRWLQKNCPTIDCLTADDRQIDWCLGMFPNLDFLYIIVGTIRYNRYRVDIKDKFTKYLDAIKQYAERNNKPFKIPQALVFTKEETKCVHNRISDYHTWGQYNSEFHKGVKKCTTPTWILARKHTNQIYLPKIGFYRNPGCQNLPARLHARSTGCCGKHALEQMENWDEFGSIVDGEGKLIHFEYTDSHGYPN
ncbi:hypothetical protein IFR05_003951 [Cadophora sp. M221]|nr:hypothetical protein IFR05_003951 [Cadophora sp. M221]